MSTQYIDHATYDNIITSLDTWKYWGNGGPYNLGMAGFNLGFLIEHGINQRNPNNKQYEGLQRLFRLVAVNNWKAYRAAYPRDCGAYERYKPQKGEYLDIWQVLKSLHCIQYNLDDYAIPELDKLVRALEKTVIYSAPEYDKAVWG